VTRHITVTSIDDLDLFEEYDVIFLHSNITIAYSTVLVLYKSLSPEQFRVQRPDTLSASDRPEAGRASGLERSETARPFLHALGGG
jgi:hypothetical protein